MKRLSSEKISHYVLYAMLGVIAIIFGLFYLLGSKESLDEEMPNSIPVMLDYLLWFMLIVFLLAFACVVYSIIRTVVRRGKI